MPKTDTIFVKDLLVRGIVGLNDWERKKKQDIVINLWVDADLRAPGASDDVDETLNYRTLTKSVIAHVEASSHLLVEKLATEIARIAVIDHGAARIRVRVEKPGALRFAESVGVDIVRQQVDFED